MDAIDFCETFQHKMYMSKNEFDVLCYILIKNDVIDEDIFKEGPLEMLYTPGIHHIAIYNNETQTFHYDMKLFERK